LTYANASALSAVTFAAGLLLLAPPAVAQQTQVNPPDQADLIAALLPTVVNITAFMVDKSSVDTTSLDTPPTASNHPKPLLGSGLIIDPSGVILTN
jgi:S1-C subfamily serine protease